MSGLGFLVSVAVVVVVLAVVLVLLVLLVLRDRARRRAARRAQFLRAGEPEGDVPDNRTRSVWRGNSWMSGGGPF